MNDKYKSFKDNGFYIAKNLLPLEAVENAMSSINHTLCQQLKAVNLRTFSTTEKNLQALFQCDLARYKKTLSALWRKLDLYEFLHDKRITNFLKNEFGWNDIFVAGGQVLHVQSESLKIPDGYFGLLPHQDYPSVQGSIGGLVTWIPIVDITLDNYPLELIPKSHKRGLLPTVEHGNSTREVKSEYFHDQDFVPVLVEKGDVVFMSNLTIHRSGLRGLQNNVRIACSTRFDNGAENSFIERSYPSAYTRSVIREQFHNILNIQFIEFYNE